MPAIHKLYLKYCVEAVNLWLQDAFPILKSACQEHGIVVDRNQVATEATAASVVLGNRVLGVLGPELSKQLENSAKAYALSIGISAYRLDFWDNFSKRVIDDDDIAIPLGVALLQRSGLSEHAAAGVRTTTAAAIGALLYAEAIMAWRRAQDHGTSEDVRA